MEHGILYYVVGASGSGKDTLCVHARRQIKEERVLFAHRYITRQAHAGDENHVALSRPEFEARKRGGLFAMSWESHGHCYGIGAEVDFWLHRGFHVVVNGSRGYLPQARALYSHMVVIEVTVSSDVLRDRLEARGRETPAEIELRMKRSFSVPSVTHPHLVTLSNDGDLAASVASFLKIITSPFQATA